MSQDLFQNFENSTKEDWLKQATKDLKGKDFEQTLVWKTQEGINIEPFYSHEDLDSEKVRLVQEAQNNKSTQSWKNRIEIDFLEEKATNLLIIKYLNLGVDEFELNFNKFEIDKINFSKLFHNINLSETPIYFQTSQPNQLFDQLSKIIHYKPKGGFAIDWINEYFTGNLSKITHQTWESTKDLIVRTSNFTQFRPIQISSEAYHNAGANTVQEIAFTLNSLISYLEKLSDLGFKIEEILQKIELKFCIGTNYFFEIAKIRAVRFLFNKILDSYQISPLNLQIHSQTSTFYNSIATPNTNMLRATTESMSAVIGGCDSLSVGRYDKIFAENTDFSTRIAKNISVLLREESYFDKVHDASSGSYFIEKLTIELAEKAWNLFLEIEEKGGILNVFESGFLRKELDKSYEEKVFEINQGKIMVGVNKFRFDEQPIEKEKINTLSNDKILINRRLASQFE